MLIDLLPQSREAIAKAQDQLEYCRDTMLIPRGLAGECGLLL